MAEANGGTMGCAVGIWVKLDLAAVDATDCAMDGTVSCANREEGRPVRTGTPEGVICSSGPVDFAIGFAAAGVSTTLDAMGEGVVTFSGFFLVWDKTGLDAAVATGSRAGTGFAAGFFPGVMSVFGVTLTRVLAVALGAALSAETGLPALTGFGVCATA